MIQFEDDKFRIPKCPSEMKTTTRNMTEMKLNCRGDERCGWAGSGRWKTLNSSSNLFATIFFSLFELFSSLSVCRIDHLTQFADAEENFFQFRVEFKETSVDCKKFHELENELTKDDSRTKQIDFSSFICRLSESAIRVGATIKTDSEIYRKILISRSI